MIIGLSGRKRSGKSTVANVLKSKGFEALSFAGPLKEIVAQAFGLDMFLLTDQESKENYQLTIYIQPLHILKMCYIANSCYYPITDAQTAYAVNNPPTMLIKTPRQLLQVVGTEVFRNCIDKDYWLNAFQAQLKPGVNYVSDDARFSNERALIKKLGGYTIGIDRPGLVQDDPHTSEIIDLSDCDFILKNKYTVDILKADVEITLDLIKELAWQSSQKRETKLSISEPSFANKNQNLDTLKNN